MCHVSMMEISDSEETEATHLPEAVYTPADFVFDTEDTEIRSVCRLRGV